MVQFKAGFLFNNDNIRYYTPFAVFTYPPLFDIDKIIGDDLNQVVRFLGQGGIRGKL